jgi:hypothetical protein
MITAVVRFRLPEGTTREDAKAMFEKSAPNYRGVPGLVRKYYLYGDDRTGAGVYLWNSREAAERFYSEAWKSTIAQRYGAQTPRSLLRTRIKKPTPRERCQPTVSPVVVHVCKEQRVELLGSYAKLGQPHRSTAARVELQLHGRAPICVIPIAHQGSGTGETIERLWAALRAGQGHDKTWRCIGGCVCCEPGGGKQRDCNKRRPPGRSL